MKSVVACILLAACAVSAAAEEFLPLETGNFWSYVTDAGYREMRVVGTQVPIFQGNPVGRNEIQQGGNGGFLVFPGSGHRAG